MIYYYFLDYGDVINDIEKNDAFQMKGKTKSWRALFAYKNIVCNTQSLTLGHVPI